MIAVSCVLLLLQEFSSEVDYSSFVSHTAAAFSPDWNTASLCYHQGEKRCKKDFISEHNRSFIKIQAKNHEFGEGL